VTAQKPLIALGLVITIGSALARAQANQPPADSAKQLSPHYLAFKRADGKAITDFESTKQQLATIGFVKALPDLGNSGILLLEVEDGKAKHIQDRVSGLLNREQGWDPVPIYQEGKTCYIPRDFLSVRFRPGTSEEKVQSLAQSLSAQAIRRSTYGAPTYVVKPQPKSKIGVEELLRSLRSNPLVVSAERDYNFWSESRFVAE